MVERGLVGRSGERGRGRRNPLAPTAGGGALREAVWPEVREANESATLGLSAAEISSLRALLRWVLPDEAGPSPNQ